MCHTDPNHSWTEAEYTPPVFPLVDASNHTRITTDGSLVETEHSPCMQGAVVNFNNDHVVFHASGPASSTEVELQAILAGITMHANTQVIDVFTNSEASISAIIKLSYGYRAPHAAPNRYTLNLIKPHIVHRKVSTKFSQNPPRTDRWLRLFHTPSHSDTKSKNKRKLKAKFSQLAAEVSKYHIAADEHAGANNTQVSYPHPLSHPCAEAACILPIHPPHQQPSLHIQRLCRDKELAN